MDKWIDASFLRRKRSCGLQRTLSIDAEKDTDDKDIVGAPVSGALFLRYQTLSAKSNMQEGALPFPPVPF